MPIMDGFCQSKLIKLLLCDNVILVYSSVYICLGSIQLLPMGRRWDIPINTSLLSCKNSAYVFWTSWGRELSICIVLWCSSSEETRNMVFFDVLITRMCLIMVKLLLECIWEFLGRIFPLFGEIGGHSWSSRDREIRVF